MNEKQIISGLKVNNNNAWEEFFRQYRPVMMNHCLKLTHNEADADDLFQKVFIQIFKHIKSFEGRSAFTTWLYTVTRNTFLMGIRRKTKVSFVPIDLMSNPLVIVDKQPERAVNRMWLFKIIGYLPPRQTQFIFARYFDGLTIQETAERFNCGTGNVKSQVSRGITKLKKMMN